MSTSFDALFTNQNERARSGDQNLGWTLFGRSMAEALRALVGATTYVGAQPVASTGVTTLMATVERVWGFALGNSSSPTSLVVGIGALLQDYVGLGETPTADDSTYRLGLNLVDTTVALPAADNLWHLLECRVSPTTVTDTRDILTNPVTRTYAPQLVAKELLKRIEFRVITGTASAIPAAQTGWTPLYGFKLPTTPASFFLSGIVDLRPSQSMLPAPATSLGDGLGNAGLFAGQTRVLSRELTTDGVSIASPLVQFRLAAQLDGQYLEAYTVTPTDSTKLISSGVLTASSWHYVYLAPAPNGFRNAGNALFAAFGVQVVGNCQVIISTQAPRPDGRNAVALTCLAPFASSSVAIGGGVCCSAVRANPAASALDAIRISPSGRAFLLPLAAFDQIIDTTARTETTLDFSGIQVLPINMVRTAEITLGMFPRTTSQTGTGVNAKLRAHCSFGTFETANASSMGGVMFDPLIAEDSRHLWVLADGAGIGSNVPPVSPTGKVLVRIETRTQAGEVSTALLSEATTGTARIACRVVGFQM